MHERDVVSEFREMRDHVADPLASLAALAKRVLRPCEIARRSLEGHGGASGQRFVVPLDQLWLVVPGLQLADRACAKDDDDVLRFAWKMRLSRRIGTRRVNDWAVTFGAEQTIDPEQIGQCDGAERGGAIR